MYRDLPYDDVAPEVRRARALAAAALRSTGAARDALARRLALVEAPAAATGVDPLLEFHACHAEAGAPEGALYVNGLIVGRLVDVHRL
jgi:microcystin degradation protein MlrC